MKTVCLFSIALCCCALFAAAQEMLPQAPPVKAEYYQIFLDAPVQKVNKVTYSDDSGEVEFKLSPDGKSIRLLDYNGTGGVKAEVVDADGMVREVVKSKCNIHSLQEL